jgi:hypothetical protein
MAWLNKGGARLAVMSILVSIATLARVANGAPPKSGQATRQAADYPRSCLSYLALNSARATWCAHYIM